MSNKIKLLHIIGSLGVGGCEKQLLELCRKLDKEKYELSLIWYSYIPGFKDAAFAMENAFRQAGTKTMHFDKFTMSVLKFIMNLRKSIKHISPDIVHTWMHSANFWGRWTAFSCGVPHLAASYRVEITDGVENNLITRISEKLLSNRTLKLANSRAVAKSLERYYGIPQEEIKIVYNAISSESMAIKNTHSEIRQELGLTQQQKIVLMVASQKKQKNYPLFVRTARHVCEHRNDVAFVGVGRRERMDELNILIEQYKLKGKIIFVGQQTDVDRWLAASDIFCFTSNYEGFPNAVLEAMMAGLPVVTTAFPGVDEIIEDTATGCIVPLNDDKAMAREVLRLLDSPAVSHQLGANAKAKVSQTYHWDTLLRGMEDLYSQLCNKNIQ